MACCYIRLIDIVNGLERLKTALRLEDKRFDDKRFEDKKIQSDEIRLCWRASEHFADIP